MPIYQYKCPHCKKEIERIEITKKETKPICIGCNAKMQKVIASSNFKVNGYNFKNGYSKK